VSTERTTLTLREKLRRPVPIAPVPVPALAPVPPERDMPPLDATIMYFIWVEGNRAPRHRHANEASCRRELERLRSMSPGRRFHMFRAERLES
jgi:hypothetical protein